MYRIPVVGRSPLFQQQCMVVVSVGCTVEGFVGINGTIMYGRVSLSVHHSATTRGPQFVEGEVTVLLMMMYFSETWKRHYILAIVDCDPPASRLWLRWCNVQCTVSGKKSRIPADPQFSFSS